MEYTYGNMGQNIALLGFYTNYYGNNWSVRSFGGGGKVDY